jgi:hypothetical protein
MRSYARKAFWLLLAFWLIIFSLEAQQSQLKAVKRKQKAEQAYKKAYARARKLTIKHRYKIQSRSTRDMMDSAQKRAEAYNRQNEPRFPRGIFRRKRPKRR